MHTFLHATNAFEICSWSVNLNRIFWDDSIFLLFFLYFPQVHIVCLRETVPPEEEVLAFPG